MLTDLIARYLDAKRKWEALWAIDEDKATPSAEWNLYNELANSVISYVPCHAGEQKLKAEFLLRDDFAFDLLANTHRSSPLRGLLMSMCCPRDPVIDLLERYQASEKEYNDCPETDRPRLEALREKHTEAMDAITSSTVTASSQIGALQAIRAALNEEKLMTDDRTLTIALLEMGLAYFDDPQGVERRPVNTVDNGEK